MFLRHCKHLTTCLELVEESLLSVEFIYCACKCGFTTWKYDSRGRERHYIRGHQFRVLVRTEQHCKRISQAKLGHEVSKDTRGKLSKHFKGKPLSNETKKKISIATTGDKNGFWKGGKYLDSDGYYRIWTPNGYVLEHRYIMEQLLGRKLTKDEVVHHKNEIRIDNRIENLQVVTKSEHNKIHLRFKKVNLVLNLLEIIGFED